MPLRSMRGIASVCGAYDEALVLHSLRSPRLCQGQLMDAPQELRRYLFCTCTLLCAAAYASCTRHYRDVLKRDVQFICITLARWGASLLRDETVLVYHTGPAQAFLGGCGVNLIVVRACAGLEGAQSTSWAELAPSEKVAAAYAFLHEGDPLLALKFLARVMASFGGSKGALSSVCRCLQLKDHGRMCIVVCDLGFGMVSNALTCI